MVIKDFSFSIVVLAEHHNPTILNPDFLIRNRIVPEDWPLDQKAPVLSTPAFSQFNFLTGVSFLMDPMRLVIQDVMPAGGIFPVPDIVEKFISTLPHVKYVSLGTNFQKVLIFPELSEARNFQKTTFLREGSWDTEGKLSEFVAHFIYSFPDRVCKVEFSGAQTLKLAMEGGGEHPVLVLSANFHRDFKAIEQHNERNQAIIAAVSGWKSDSNAFETITQKLTGVDYGSNG